MTNLVITWDVDPVLFDLFGFQLRYYSLSWMFGFLACIYVMNKMLKKEGLSPKITDSMFLYTFTATVVGARVGHCLFYEGTYYLQHPLEILKIWEGGLASHGAALGLLVGIYLFSKKNNFKYIWSLDRITTVIPIGGAFIRFGNLMNSEIYGTPTDLSWGFRFITNMGRWKAGIEEPIYSVPSHPTQIYEIILYLAIFALLTYLFFKKDLAVKRPGAIFGIFLITLFGGRYVVEMIKNVQETFEASMTLNMGQILSIPFVLLGCVVLYLAYRKKSIFR